ncbi:MAG: hypothetical protein Q9168_003500 [Polycauliona sp. 1 TL-2023]
MTKFRPCIDLHSGQVKQIVGGTLSDTDSELKTNHVSKLPASHFANLYKEHGLNGAHVIMLGSGNEEAAHEALSAWPSGLQLGGGITAENARKWIEHGAEKVIVTSYLFPEARFSLDRLEAVLAALDGDVQKLVIDLSCRRTGGKWMVAMNKWQTLTGMEVNQETIKLLEPYCSEFLIHAADNEGLQGGIDKELVIKLGQWCTKPVTYAGGARYLQDLELVRDLSAGKVDLTIGSALDVFGGSTVVFEDCVRWNQQQSVRPKLASLVAKRLHPTNSLRAAHHLHIYHHHHEARRIRSQCMELVMPPFPSIRPHHETSGYHADISPLAVSLSPSSPSSSSQSSAASSNNHHSMVGTTKDPDNGPAVAGSVFAAVIVYVVFLVFCGFQAFLHNRQSKRGAISLN